MEGVISESVKSSLLKNRDLLNSMFRSEGSLSPGPDPEGFGRVLMAFLEIISRAEAGRDSSGAPQLPELFSVLLNLYSAGDLRLSVSDNDDNPLMAIAEKYPDLLAQNPGEFLTGLARALAVFKSPEAAERWRSLICLMAPCVTDLESFRNAGLVSAWLAGKTRFRSRALELARSLDPGLMSRLFGLDAVPSEKHRLEILDALASDPWISPGDIAAHVKVREPIFSWCGGYEGYGGPFSRLPEVISDEGALYALSGNNRYIIFADIFGSDCVPCGPVIEGGSPKINGRSHDGCSISLAGVSISIPDRFRSSPGSLAVQGTTAVWTSPDSYRVFIAGLPGGSV